VKMRWLGSDDRR